MNKKLTQKQKQALVSSIIDFLFKHELQTDTIIYCDNKRYTFDVDVNKDTCMLHTTDLGRAYFIKNDIKASQRVKYANDDTLTMTFEGSLYTIMNGCNDCCQKLQNEFNQLLEPYELYYEQGHAWSLALYFE